MSNKRWLLQPMILAVLPVQVALPQFAAHAQGHPAFDAVVVKRAKSGPLYPRLDMDPGYLSAKAASLHFLILQAFGLEEFQLSDSDGWTKSDLYSIHAAAGKRASSSEMMAMLRDLLQSRFRLVVHRETRELPVYALTVDKDGAKLTALAHVDDSPSQSTVRGSFVTRPVGSSIPELVHYLNAKGRLAAIGLPVVDRTGLQGLYRIRLRYDTVRNADNTGGTFLIDYFAELPRQLGLRLLQTKLPIDMLVVDGVQKPELDQ